MMRTTVLLCSLALVFLLTEAAAGLQAGLLDDQQIRVEGAPGALVSATRRPMTPGIHPPHEVLATAPEPLGVIGPETPNLLLILADDMGVDLVGAYGEGANPPCTPNLDLLAGDGLLFRNAWTNPLCTPSRAQLLTGRHGFRTGLGTVGAGGNLPAEEVTLPERLTGYSSAAIGKWGVGAMQGATHPNDSGFDYFAGSLGNFLEDYSDWNKTVNGLTSSVVTYATSDVTNEAIQLMQTLPEPWFLYVCYNAPHTPAHVPPAHLCPQGPCTSFCASNPGGVANRIKSMTEALDTEIGRLFQAMEVVDPEAFVVFMGDNGTAAQATEPPFDSARAKGSMYEGGINVPLIVNGPGVAVGESVGLVSSSDLMATFAELAGLEGGADDSVSLVPYFSDPTLALRTAVYSERFSPNHGTSPFDDHQLAIRNAGYKLIQRTGQPDELYDLVSDPFETLNLLPALAGTVESENHLALLDELAELYAGDEVEPWTDLGDALAGSFGAPELTGTGTLTASSPTTVTLSSALNNSTAYLVVGVSQIDSPLKGGVLVPSLDLVKSFGTGSSGSVVLDFAWPTTVPSNFSTYLQYWVADAAGPVGFSASNGLSATTP